MTGAVYVTTEEDETMRAGAVMALTGAVVMGACAAPAFELTNHACAVPAPEGRAEADLTCGTLSAPENRARHPDIASLH